MLDALKTDLLSGFNEVSPVVSAARLVAALVLGALIGLEREIKGKPAGLRTHVLVSAGAALFVIVGLELGDLTFGENGSHSIDPLRLIEAVTAGVAFLAAGLIFTSGGKVRNITTGAALWLSGAIGLACGAGEVPLAAMATVLVLIVISVLGWLETRTGLNDGQD
ncbi:MgtC/SapB family protein [Histidinibacterium lentulum]|uniref:MgtC/SapB family protein n=1 Tax=Histidinibacterium lentulum TaxID=2480588 RepID=UPI001FE83D96|nr:MgtC/SapB family protein [Histidinibacterium lentulum]